MGLYTISQKNIPHKITTGFSCNLKRYPTMSVEYHSFQIVPQETPEHRHAGTRVNAPRREVFPGETGGEMGDVKESKEIWAEHQLSLLHHPQIKSVSHIKMHMRL